MPYRVIMMDGSFDSDDGVCRTPRCCRGKVPISVVLGLVFFLFCHDALAQSDGGAHPRPSWPWFFSQLIPSPQLVVQRDQAAFGARWQLTPILFSQGIHRSQNPWRTFVVEPIVRHSGSLEWFVSPEYLALGDDMPRHFGVRTGLRSYWPLIERGDYLSLSFGTSALRFQQITSVAYETGVHVLFGLVGFMTSCSPTPRAQRCIMTLQVRVF
ncbi:MAG TPA: hypothetical protein PLJ27_20655 [Polyangiaceae bacterium]|jgi:hypothetical protein|nr:MAG: hypothetical protein BWY17_03819 [Deltaproteobacteria bacterium ADurb.Bin207]HNT00048.1 hypothetical protein [Polyangiaceae bacterium]HNZ21447.1 hypothetical protein [Polyangiaceae bacterium]HOD23764.1 hypothetical protein [Polyangiaceae bacterium]HOE51181.1 hypothetical protein [Polyangiaceae bacterium]